MCPMYYVRIPDKGPMAFDRGNLTLDKASGPCTLGVR